MKRHFSWTGLLESNTLLICSDYVVAPSCHLDSRQLKPLEPVWRLCQDIRYENMIETRHGRYDES